MFEFTNPPKWSHSVFSPILLSVCESLAHSMAWLARASIIFDLRIHGWVVGKVYSNGGGCQIGCTERKDVQELPFTFYTFPS